MTPIKVIFLEPTDRERRWLRRYSKECGGKPDSYCNAMVDVGEGPYGIEWTDKPEQTDPRWPTKCNACGRAFGDSDPFQLFDRRIYENKSAGIRCTLADAPAGACWDATWISERRKDTPTGCGYMVGDDHRSLIVRCPDDHDWMIDGRAKNCTLPDEPTHHCWVRHGRPEDGDLHVDKNGHTCAAGAGSIQTPKWHGFLHHGFLHE